MLRPIIACHNPYRTARLYESAGWIIEFSNPPKGGDPLVGVSLYENKVLLGVTEGYVREQDIGSIGCGIVFYIDVPKTVISAVHKAHRVFNPTDIALRSWGDSAFDVVIGGIRFTIASSS